MCHLGFIFSTIPQIGTNAPYKTLPDLAPACHLPSVHLSPILGEVVAKTGMHKVSGVGFLLHLS